MEVDWHIAYVNMAQHLSEQGYHVFTSSHKQVRDEIVKRSIDSIIICPAMHLKDEWTDKLRNRYEEIHTDKNFKALKNCEEMYLDNIYDLLNQDGFRVAAIESIEYDLKSFLLYHAYLKSEIEQHRTIPANKTNAVLYNAAVASNIKYYK